jgi:hypothetical protein
MILESAQMLSTVNPSPSAYKPTHKNHPCTLWTAASINNYKWLRDLALHLGFEYTYRYGKTHKSIGVIKSLPYPEHLPDIPQTPFALAMPDQYKNACAITSYRAYYVNEKKDILKYTKRAIPSFITT